MSELILCACGCGTELPALNRQGRPRRFVHGHNGSCLSPETLRRRSETLRGHPVSAETRAKLSAAGQGVRPSAETRAKLSAAKLGKRASAETRAKMSASLRGRHLSAEHRAHLSAAKSGANHPSWKGGRKENARGYVEVFRPDHPAAGAKGYVREHRLVMEGILGRYLTPQEIPHHIDGDRANNAPENLRLFESQAEHARFHKEEAEAERRRRMIYLHPATSKEMVS